MKQLNLNPNIKAKKEIEVENLFTNIKSRDQVKEQKT